MAKKPEYQRLETERFLKRHGITNYRRNPFFPVNTLTLMRGAIAAQRVGVFGRYVDEMYRHMWSEPKKMDDPQVWRAALLETGFDAPRFEELVQAPEIKDAVVIAERAEWHAVSVKGEKRATAVAIGTGRAGDEKTHCCLLLRLLLRRPDGSASVNVLLALGALPSG